VATPTDSAAGDRVPRKAGARPTSSAADYFAAAGDLMATGDPRRVTIDALCKKVGTTSGSFYHHFGSLDGFVDSLAANWSERNIATIQAAVANLGDLRGVRRLVNEKLLLQHHELEAAFRAWARTNESMRRAVLQVDQARFEASRIMVAALNPQLRPDQVEAGAQIAVLILIGAQAHDPATAAEVSASALASLASLIEQTLTAV
jgi:AcrR family transcriptional regulator